MDNEEVLNEVVLHRSGKNPIGFQLVKGSLPNFQEALYFDRQVINTESGNETIDGEWTTNPFHVKSYLFSAIGREIVENGAVIVYNDFQKES